MSIGFVSTPPSARSRRLADRLTETIDSFRRENPHTTTLEIQQALQVAKRSQGGPARMAIIIGVLLAILFGLGMLYFADHR